MSITWALGDVKEEKTGENTNNCNVKQSMAKVSGLEFLNSLEKYLVQSEHSENVCLFLLHVQLDANALRIIMHYC